MQPYVRSVDVRIDRRMLSENVSGYGELEGSMIFAEVEIESWARLYGLGWKYDTDKDYPMMKLI